MRDGTTLARTTPPEGRRRSPTRLLGIVGWSRLDPILLAALASERPVLLVGEHGTGKTHLIRRIAQALGLTARIYDASQVQLEDLVGVFYPDESGERLKFIASDASIWDAELVLIDELSRARPDMANRLFTLVLDRAILGHSLERLRLRFAAMNPPSAGDEEDEDGYLGALPLDPALADRFDYVVRVRHWRDFSRREREELVRVAGRVGSEDGSSELPALVERTRRAARSIPEKILDQFAEYLLTVSEALDADRKVVVSGRRLGMMREALCFVHGARSVLEGVGMEVLPIEPTLRLVIENTLPQAASARWERLQVALEAAHKQACERIALDPDDPRSRIQRAEDPVEKILIAEGVKNEPALLSRVLQSVVQRTKPSWRRTALALTALLRYRESDRLDTTAMELLDEATRGVLAPPALVTASFGPPGGRERLSLEGFRRFVASGLADGSLAALEAAFLVREAGNLVQSGEWEAALEELRSIARRLEVDLRPAWIEESLLGGWASQLERRWRVRIR